MHYAWDWGVFWLPSPEGDGSYGAMLVQGFGTTLLTALCAGLLALLLGSVVGVVRSLPGRAGRGLAAGWIEVFRNVPLLVQLFLWYFVVPELLPTAWGLWLKQLPSASFVTAAIGIGLFSSARVAVQVAAGIAALPSGQLAASSALGLTLGQSYRHVLLPRAFRIILPPLTGEMLNLVKNTSVALTIGLAELTARAVAEFSQQIFEAFAAATILYLAINLLATVAAGWVERRAAMPDYGA